MKDYAANWLSDQKHEASRMSDQIWALAEPGLCEVRSGQVLTDYLERQGFSVRTNLNSLPSSFIATYGSGGPHIGLVCEYDATPGESQGAVPYKWNDPARAAGFTDLHNGIGVASAVAAAAIARATREFGETATISVFGTAAEKLCLGKPVMARSGLFDDIDAFVAWHPRMYTTAEWDDGPGVQIGILYEFTGVTNFSARPWDAINALDTMMYMDSMVKSQLHTVHRSENASISRIIVNGGGHPTSIPGRASIWYIGRSKTLAGTDKLKAILDSCADAACKASGATVASHLVSRTRPWVPNHVLASLAYENLQAYGGPSFSDNAVSFANDILTNLGRATSETPFDETIREPWSGVTRDFAGGTDDINELGWHAPTVRIYVTQEPSGPQMPNWARGALTGTDAAHSTIAAASRAMATTGLDVLFKEGVLDEARQEFCSRVQGESYIPPLLDDNSVIPLGEYAPPFVKDHELRRLTAAQASQQ